MKKITILIIWIIVLSNYSFATDDGEFQYWNTESVSYKINQDLKMKLEEEFRFGDDGGNLYYQHSDLGLSYSGLTDWLDLAINYRQVFEKKSGEWKYENRPHLNASVAWKMFDIACGNRARFEYRHREDSENYWRYRNKLTVKLPFKFTALEIQPYIADEIFYDFDEETLNRNRLYAGFSLRLFKDLKGDMFYLWQSSKSNDKWSDIHVLGTKLNLSF